MLAAVGALMALRWTSVCCTRTEGCSLRQTSFQVCSADIVAMGGGKAVALSQEGDGQVQHGMHKCRASL